MVMGSIFVIQGLLIYIYGFDHNPRIYMYGAVKVSLLSHWKLAR